MAGDRDKGVPESSSHRQRSKMSGIFKSLIDPASTHKSPDTSVPWTQISDRATLVSNIHREADRKVSKDEIDRMIEQEAYA